jgi:hypothetical protein
MKENRKIEQRGPLGNTLSRKTTTNLPLDAEEDALFVSTYIIQSLTDIITFQPTEIYITLTMVLLLVLTTIMNDKQLCLAAVWTWTSTLRKW